MNETIMLGGLIFLYILYFTNGAFPFVENSSVGDEKYKKAQSTNKQAPNL